ncbi:MAG: putative Zn-dependent protease, contains repeat [Micavibrio sp.]|nr:putative Zn-dependent protease, contains repeat [Micavibrio sp.]
MIMMKSRVFSLLTVLVAGAAILAVPLDAFAQRDPSPNIIRDTEIEESMKEWTRPLIIAAGLEPSAVRFILVQDDDINAFVAGGQNVFIYSGLIEKTKNPGELIGVIAHELGHIRGGHLVRLREEMENASYEAILGMVLGIGAAVVTGDGGAAAAGSMAGQTSAMSGFLAFSRVQESSADQSALYEFDHARMNPTGFQSFMEQLKSQELLPSSEQSKYVRTHPLTRDRIEAIEGGVAKSPYKDVAWPAVWTEEHARIVAKLTGFITPGKVAFQYDDRDRSVAANYARTIAAYRQSRVEESLGMIEDLLKAEPQNPYFHELKGQMLLDYGRVPQSIASLRKAVSLKGDAPLIRVLYAQALIADSRNGQDRAELKEAISQLDHIQSDEGRTPKVQHLLAMAYGYQGLEAEAQLHLADEAALTGNYKDARRLAESAAGQLKKGSRSWLRAQDILSYINVADKNKYKDQDSRHRRTQ